MDPAIRQGFAIGLVLAAAAGYVGWRQGWWPSPAVTAKLESIAPSTEPDLAKPPAPKADRAAPPAQKSETPPSAATKSPPPPGDVAALSPPAKSELPAAKPQVENGAFDVVRVEPTGEAVVAGRCAANCVVELTANGKTHDKVTADAAGNWAMTPPILGPGDYQLGLKVTNPDGKSATSEQSVTVSVPDTPKGEVVVVLNEPNAPSKILQRPGQAPAAAKPTAEATREPGGASKSPAQTVAAVSIGAVDAEKGRLFVQGTAPASAALRVYLNNALIAQPVAGRNERWSVRVERGLAPGEYVARVDHVEKPSGKVLARAEAKFAYEGEVAQSAPMGDRPAAEKPGQAQAPAARKSVARPEAEAVGGAAAPPPGPTPPGPSEGKTTTFARAPDSVETKSDGTLSNGTAGSTPQGAVADAPATPAPTAEASVGAPDASAADAANPVVASIDTTNVSRGDSLWRISRKTYGSGTRYTVIFTANDKQIRNPALIYPGQVLVLPEDPAKAASRGSTPAQ